MAVAVAGAMGAPLAAFAQASNVQIYGTIDMSVHVANYGSTNDIKTSKNTVDAIGSQTKNDLYSQSSRLGFKGTEDLGNGLKAWFQVENGLNIDGRQQVNTGSWAGRNSALGLEGGFGNVFVGLWDTPYKAVLAGQMGAYGGGYLQHNGMLLGGGADSTGTNPNVGTDCMGATQSANGAVNTTSITSNLTTQCNQLEGNATSFHRRVANVIQYWSPTIAGFQGKIAYSGNGQRTSSVTSAPTAAVYNTPTLFSAGLAYAAGPASASLSYERHQGFRATGNGAIQSASATITTKNDAVDTGLLLAGAYDFGAVKITALYERLRYGDTAPAAYPSTYLATGGAVLGATDFERTGWFLGATVPVSNGRALVGYSTTGGNKSCGSLGTGTAGANTVAGTAGAVNLGTFFCGGDTGASAWTLGYEHNLSKRTQIYTTYMNVDNKSQATFLPVVNKNNVNGTTGSTFTGQDFSALTVGMRHSF